MAVNQLKSNNIYDLLADTYRDVIASIRGFGRFHEQSVDFLSALEIFVGCEHSEISRGAAVGLFMKKRNVRRSAGGHKCQMNYGEVMRWCGIDLAADPKNTGLAVLRDENGRLIVDFVAIGNTDDDIIDAVSSAELTGVDIPFGWPQPFVALLQAHAEHKLPSPMSTGPQWRRELALRTTDREIHRLTGLMPLSVSANLIAYPAFRWAGIEARLRESRINVNRDGSGAVAEVYPAAALHCWGMPYRGYKSAQGSVVRQQIVEEIARCFPRLEWNGYQTLVEAHDDALDAVIASLVSQQILRGHCHGPPERFREIAKSEGWIWIPKRIEGSTIDNY